MSVSVEMNLLSVPKEGHSEWKALNSFVNKTLAVFNSKLMRPNFLGLFCLFFEFLIFLEFNSIQYLLYFYIFWLRIIHTLKDMGKIVAK